MGSPGNSVAKRDTVAPIFSSNPALDQLIKKTPTTTAADYELNSTTDVEKKVIFEKSHREASASHYPNFSHATNEREKNIETQENLKRLRDIEIDIKLSEKDLKQAKKNGNKESARSIREHLRLLSQQKNQLLGIADDNIKIRNSGSTRKDQPSRHGTTQASKPDSIASRQTENVNANNSMTHASDHLQERSLVELAHMLEALQDDLEKAEERLSKYKKMSRPANDIAAEELNIHSLQSDIQTLQRTLVLFSEDFTTNLQGEVNSTSQSPQPEIDGSAPSSPATHELIRRVTKRGQRSEIGVKPLKRSENPARNSTLYTSEDIRTLLNTKGKKIAKGIDHNIDRTADEFDHLMVDRGVLKQKIDAEDDPDVQSNLLAVLKVLDKKILATSGKLNRIIDKTETIEKTARKQVTQLSDEEKEKRYITLTNRFKSESTKDLEKKYKDLLENYVKENASGTTVLTMLGGALANIGTLTIGGGVARTLSAYGASFAGIFAGAAVGGSLHAVLTLPILKQVMRETWTSPILNEYNNYWKLVGASWGDWWRDETKKAKYVSKHPENPNLLTIDQRLAEEKSFWELFKTRYRVEEMPYFSFMGNYICKALAGSTLPHLSLSATATALTDAAMHLPMGWISGAETSLGIQEQRSQLPTAKLVPIPSREIAAAEADYLDALLAELTQGMHELRQPGVRKPEDPTDREILKAITKTRKALASAKLRSQLLGTLRQEVKAEYANQDAFLDVLTEKISRTLVLLPSGAISYLMASWRASPDPLTAALGHIIPAILLILPPGWTLRPITSGVIRAALQALFNGRAPDIATDNNSGADKGVTIPDLLRPSSPDSTDTSKEGDVSIDIGAETSGDEADESSEVVGPVTEGDVTDSDDEWHGQENRDFIGS